MSKAKEKEMTKKEMGDWILKLKKKSRELEIANQKLEERLEKSFRNNLTLSAVCSCLFEQNKIDELRVKQDELNQRNSHEVFITTSKEKGAKIFRIWIEKGK